MPKYTLTVKNQSSLTTGKFAVFAKIPVETSLKTLHTAWFVQQIDEGNTHKFEWTLDWGFEASSSGVEADYTWSAETSRDADPTDPDHCNANLVYDGDFKFTDSPDGGPAGGSTLKVFTNDSVKGHAAAVAVTLAGSAAGVAEVGPNLTTVYTLHPTYFIDAGEYTRGQMVDTSSVADLKPVVFGDGVYDMLAVLDSSNKWTITPL